MTAGADTGLREGESCEPVLRLFTFENCLYW